MSNGTKKNELMIMRDFINSRRSDITLALPPDIKYEQILQAITVSAALNPDILACTKQSLYFAVLHACRDGLLPDGKEGAIVPFKDKAQFIPMYQGLLRRFRRSGKFKSVSAHVVREGEEFSYFIDENGPHLRHIPGDNFDAPIVRVYARASTLDGGIFIDVMSKAEVDKHRKMSRASREDRPWEKWPEEMTKKTAIIRMSKYLPDARDILPNEDQFNDDDGSAPITSAPINSGKTYATIEASAAGHPTSQTAEDGGGEAKPEAPKDASAAQQSSSTPADNPAAADTDSKQPAPELFTKSSVTASVIEAYRRGAEARDKNGRRAAIPREYTDGKHDELAAAWLAGFDKKSPPTEEARP